MEHTEADKKPIRRRTGRPLSFDRDTALARAMHVFWRHGYETSSVADLTTAMGITAPSLYTAFGDKKRLFLAAVDRYVGDPAAMRDRIEAAPTARDAARDLLTASAIAFTGEATPPGCLLASAAASGSAESADVQHAVAAVRVRVVEALQLRIARDIADGTLPGDTDPHALAMLVVALIQGMSVLARDGYGRERLVVMGEAGLRGWPAAASPV